MELTMKSVPIILVVNIGGTWYEWGEVTGAFILKGTYKKQKLEVSQYSLFSFVLFFELLKNNISCDL